MPCNHPLTAYRSLTKKTDNGKSVIEFKKENLGSCPSEEIELPCGRCTGCRIDKSREWALRCMHEASLYDYNCFITLTFNEENLNPDRTLVKSDFTKFMKRFRKKHNGIQARQATDNKIDYPIRFFQCGEYGSDFSRPHHHAIIFNYDFPDKVIFSQRDGIRVYTSESLERLWSKRITDEEVQYHHPDNVFEERGKTYAKLGFCTIGDVTFQSCAYVARYIMKKQNGAQGLEHYLIDCNPETGEAKFREPEYITMSRRPGIAKDWLKTYQKDVYPSDFLTHDGKKFKIPKYYDKIFELTNEKDLNKIKYKRKTQSLKNRDNNTIERRFARETVLNAKISKLERNLEK
jgi:hypothetical protein